MPSPSPVFVLKRAGKPLADIDFWTFQSAPKLIAAYGAKEGVHIWDFETRRCDFSIPSDSAMLSVHGFSSGELLTLDKEGSLKVIDVNDGVLNVKMNLVIPNIAFCKAAVWSTASTPNRVVGVPGEEKSSINIWDLNEEKIVSQLIPTSQFKLGMPWCVKLLGQNRPIVLIGYEDGSMLCWDVSERKILSKAAGLFTDPVMCFDAFEDHEHLISGAAGSANDNLVKWNSNYDLVDDVTDVTVNNFSILQRQKLINKGLSCIKIRQDNRILATGGWDHKTRIFSWRTLKPLAVLDYHTGSIQCMAFSDDKLLACGSTDHRISVWKIFSD